MTTNEMKYSECGISCPNYQTHAFRST